MPIGANGVRLQRTCEDGDPLATGGYNGGSRPAIPQLYAGLAVIRYMVAFDEGNVPETSGYFLATLLESPLFADGGANV